MERKNCSCANSALAIAFWKSTSSELETLPRIVAVEGSIVLLTHHNLDRWIIELRNQKMSLTNNFKGLILFDPLAVNECLRNEQSWIFQLLRVNKEAYNKGWNLLRQLPFDGTAQNTSLVMN